MKLTVLSIVTFALVSLSLLTGCGGSALKAPESARDQFEKGMRAFEKKKYMRAVEEFQVLVYNFPGTDFIDSAQYYLALSYYGDRDYELAAVEFRRLVNSYPRSEFADDAQFMAGVCYYENTPGHYGLDQEDLKRAINALSDFTLDNPDSPLVEQAEQIILKARSKLAKKEYRNGFLYLKMLDYQAAKIYFQYVIDEYTDTEYAARSLFKLAEIDYKMKDFSAASEKFNQFVNIYNDSELISRANEYLEKISIKLETSNVPDES
ncbi:MAG: outer membrane protein assembly factor BamD [Candidatus Zixiibacteriota bacterium]|nr:MAG: outer membrane protein assembly factor BamD [candidate division Zixibacteria bacterium]